MKSYEELIKDHPNSGVFDLPALLGVNHSNDYQERTLLVARVLVDFLVQNNLLINFQPYNENGEIRKDLVITISHLNREGLELFRKSVNNWFKAHDRGTPIEKTKKKKKGLAKIRQDTSIEK